MVFELNVHQIHHNTIKIYRNRQECVTSVLLIYFKKSTKLSVSMFIGNVQCGVKPPLNIASVQVLNITSIKCIMKKERESDPKLENLLHSIVL